ncbi:MAG: hypothetical protein KGM17_00080 [Sphingomonadales bacterium]|nr:hypothetical protein [Sphingomonadales bacterium]
MIAIDGEGAHPFRDQLEALAGDRTGLSDFGDPALAARRDAVRSARTIGTG